MNNSRIDGKVLVQCPTVGWNPSRISTIATTAITAIACPFAILLNGLVILGVIKKKQLRSVTCILLASLAAADLLIAAVTEPLFIAAGIFRLLDDYEAMCGLVVIFFFTLYLICTVVYHLTALAWERCVAIKKAVKYKVIVTRGRVKMCAIASWVLTAISAIPSALYVAGFIDKKQFVISKTCFFSVPMTICLVAITALYIMIYLETRRRRQIPVIQLLSQIAMNAAIERRVAKTTFLLTVTLFLSLAPTFVLWFFFQLFDFTSQNVFQWAVTLNQLNSLANPILYFYRNRRFRNTVLEMLNMRKPAKNQIPQDILPQDPNAMQPNCTRAKPKSCKPNVFMEKRETSNASRPKTAPFCSFSHAMTRDENNPLNPNSGFSGVSRIRAATIGDIGMQVDLATFSQKEQDLQRKEHRYANKPISLPTNKNRTKCSRIQCLNGTFMFTKPPGNQIPTDELSQDPNNTMQYNHTRAKRNAWETTVSDEKQEASNATRSKKAAESLDNVSKANVIRLTRLRAATVGAPSDIEVLCRKNENLERHSYTKNSRSLSVISTIEQSHQSSWQEQHDCDFIMI